MFRRSSFLLALIALAGCAQQKAGPGVKAEANSPEPIYGKEMQFAVPLQKPTGIAKAIDAIYAVGDRQVLKFDMQGKLQQTIQIQEEPTCVAVSPGQRVLVASANRVYELVNGQFQSIVMSASPKAQITSMSASDLYLWIADAGARRIYRVLLQSLEMKEFGAKTKDYPGLIVPSPHLDVAVLSNEDVIWTNPGAHRFEQHNSEGKLLKAWGKASMDIDGFAGCCNPTDVAVFSDNTIVTAEKGLPRIKVYWRGKFDNVVSPASDRSEKSAGIDLVSDGLRIWALDPFAKNITVYMHKDKLK